jgi:hypothetical protein
MKSRNIFLDNGGDILVICPKVVTIRRTKVPHSDRLTISPIGNTASIANIVVNIDEPVMIRLLAFHVIGMSYCSNYKIVDAEKRFCSDIKSQYVHFHIQKDGYPPEKSEFLIACLPRNKTEGELYQLAKELCDITEWLDIKQKTNCIIFRYGPPVHWMDDSVRWQKQLEIAIKETRINYLIGQIAGRIKHVREDDNRNLTIYNADLFESINIS